MVFRLLQHTVFRWRLILNLQKKTEESEANYTELTTTYSTAKMDVVASELNTAIIELWTAQNEGADFPTTPISVFIRLKATITDSDRGVCISKCDRIAESTGQRIHRQVRSPPNHVPRWFYARHRMDYLETNGTSQRIGRTILETHFISQPVMNSSSEPKKKNTSVRTIPV